MEGDTDEQCHQVIQNVCVSPKQQPSWECVKGSRKNTQTYCHNQQRRWSEYLSNAEEFINLSHHQAIDTTPYTAMFEKPPPREIAELINFPQSEEYKFENVKFYNKILERTEKRRKKYQEHQPKPIEYNVGDQVLLKNRELLSTIEGIAKELLLLYTWPYTITKKNGNNTYELMDLSLIHI